ncbi:hypothetical protein BYT27DRAFT_7261168 [Phlegmacium glaucopus]|nr:hypothetical protein BYT27DRAFT_7261168 [Phlegmacium glaucopus]
MSEINNLSIALVLLAVSTIFVIHPLSFYIRLPIIGRTRMTIGSTTAFTLAVILLWLWAQEVQCNDASQDHDSDGIAGTLGTDDIESYNILILCLALAFIAIILHVTGIIETAAFWVNDQGDQILYCYFYEVLLATITTPLLPETPPPSTPATTTFTPGVTNDDDVENESKYGVDAGWDETALMPSTSSPSSSLTLSDTVLGFGSYGTVLYEGSFQGRPVAIKRLLRDFVTIATREVSILQQSDDHPNVIRYYYHESRDNFIYIALELCPASLADIIENPSAEGDEADSKWVDAFTWTWMLISDFGLCKKLNAGQTSFVPTANGGKAPGTVGWRAPEILRGDVKLDELPTGNDSTSSRGSVATVNGGAYSSGTISPKTRLTKSIDIFALGCLFYYILTKGGHPYGYHFEREVNIVRDDKRLFLYRSAEDSTEAIDLITAMLHPQPSQRPNTRKCLLHPFFWDPLKRLGFLQDVSDRFGSLCRDPIHPTLTRLERGARSIVGMDWHQRLDKTFVETLREHRKYDGTSVRDLLRALRNKKHHYQDLPADVQRNLGSIPDGFLRYFTRRFPTLFMHVYGVVNDTRLDRESMFKTYFELPES